MKAMTFLDFVESLKECSDLGNAKAEQTLHGRPGLISPEGLWLERFLTGASLWRTRIGNHEYTGDDLYEVALPLFRHGVSRDMFVELPWPSAVYYESRDYVVSNRKDGLFLEKAIGGWVQVGGGDQTINNDARQVAGLAPVQGPAGARADITGSVTIEQVSGGLPADPYGSGGLKITVYSRGDMVQELTLLTKRAEEDEDNTKAIRLFEKLLNAASTFLWEQRTIDEKVDAIKEERRARAQSKEE